MTLAADLSPSLSMTVKVRVARVSEFGANQALFKGFEMSAVKVPDVFDHV
jgi:hypothetical protein